MLTGTGYDFSDKAGPVQVLDAAQLRKRIAALEQGKRDEVKSGVAIPLEEATYLLETALAELTKPQQENLKTAVVVCEGHELKTAQTIQDLREKLAALEKEAAEFSAPQVEIEEVTKVRTMRVSDPTQPTEWIIATYPPKGRMGGARNIPDKTKIPTWTPSTTPPTGGEEGIDYKVVACGTKEVEDPSQPAAETRTRYEYDIEQSAGVLKAKAVLDQADARITADEQAIQAFSGKRDSYDAEVELLQMMRISTTDSPDVIADAVKRLLQPTEEWKITKEHKSQQIKDILTVAAKINLSDRQTKQGHDLSTIGGVSRYLQARITDDDLADYVALSTALDTDKAVQGKRQEDYKDAQTKAERWRVDGEGKRVGKGYSEAYGIQTKLYDTAHGYVRAAVMKAYLEKYAMPPDGEVQKITGVRKDIAELDEAVEQTRKLAESATKKFGKALSREPELLRLMSQSVDASVPERQALVGQIVTILNPLSEVNLGGAKGKMPKIDADAIIKALLRDDGVQVSLNTVRDMMREIGGDIDIQITTVLANGNTFLGSPEELARRVLNVEIGEAENAKLVEAPPAPPARPPTPPETGVPGVPPVGPEAGTAAETQGPPVTRNEILDATVGQDHADSLDTINAELQAYYESQDYEMVRASLEEARNQRELRNVIVDFVNTDHDDAWRIAFIDQLQQQKSPLHPIFKAFRDLGITNPDKMKGLLKILEKKAGFRWEAGASIGVVLMMACQALFQEEASQAQAAHPQG